MITPSKSRFTTILATGLIAAALVPASAIAFTESGTPGAAGESGSGSTPQTVNAAAPYVVEVSSTPQTVTATAPYGGELPPTVQSVNAAAPFSTEPSPTLAKSAEEADPFVAEVSAELPQPAAIGDGGFQWGDALIGTGATLAGVAVALAAAGALRVGRKRYPASPQGAAS